MSRISRYVTQVFTYSRVPMQKGTPTHPIRNKKLVLTTVLKKSQTKLGSITKNLQIVLNIFVLKLTVPTLLATFDRFKLFAWGPFGLK